MKTSVFILFVLVLLQGISSKESINSTTEKASLIPLFIENNHFNVGLRSELLQAKKSGILSEYQFSLWVGVYGMVSGRDETGRVKFTKKISEAVTVYNRTYNTEMEKYRSSDWAFYNNKAYAGDWEIGLWQLAE